MSTDPKFRTRRAFLQTAAVASAGLVVPSFISRTAQLALGEGADEAPAAPRKPIPGFRDDHVLVVVQLGGGNDGLNCVVPYANDNYHRARSVLRLRENRLIKLNDELAFNDRMAPLKELFDDGKLAVVNGVGYPNPNRSHFRSMEIWQTASNAEEFLYDGWIGRYFDNYCSGEARPQVGVNIGGDTPQAFGGEKGLGVAFEQPAGFAWQPGHEQSSEELFRKLNRLEPGSVESTERTVDFLRHVSTNIVLASDEVREAANRGRPGSDYPSTPLAQRLRHISRLIQGELGTRIYYVNQGGYDTHANQGGQHDTLLEQLSQALAAFYKDLRQAGHSRRVLVIGFSEFGRRVNENGSRGTDHGTAGPMFLLGDPVRPGLHGSYPSMSELDRGGDLLHTTDFRSVYATVLKQWFNVNPKPVLGGREFLTLNLIRG